MQDIVLPGHVTMASNGILHCVKEIGVGSKLK
jgi:hypothetical protein